MKPLYILTALCVVSNLLPAQNVGIGTKTPNATARLHVDVGASTTSGIVFSGSSTGLGTVPDLGEGSRLMFYPGKAAFRAGTAYSTEWNNINVGFGSVAMGSGTTASGFYSFAMGDAAKATGNFSSALGQGTISRGYGATAIGIFNEPILATAETSIAETSPLFIIGNGSGSGRSNAMVVLKNGNVGIGTNAPTETLVLNAAAAATLQLQEAGVEKAFVQLSGDNLRIGVYGTNPTGNVVFRLNTGDRFTIFPTGNATLTGTLTQNSDERFKQDITPIYDALDKVLQLNGYEYRWKPELQKDSALQIGLIAQNVEKVLPQLVVTDKEGLKSVAYQNMVPVLVEAIKELQQQIKDQHQQIKDLKSKNGN